MNKYIIIAGLIIIIAGAGIGFYMYNKPVQGVQTMKTDIEINATELLAEFNNDENEANGKFLDKVIEVTGTVSNVSKESIVTIYLAAGDPISQVICQLNESENQVPKEGETITIKGICSGYLMDVVIVRAIII